MRYLVRTTSAYFGLALAMAAACGGGGADDQGLGDDGTDPDASTGTPDAEGGNDCPGARSYDATAPLQQAAYWVGASEDAPAFVVGLGQLTADEPFDGVQLELYAGAGVFAGRGIEPGTYELTGDELDYQTCGLCVLLQTELVDSTPGATYLATGGTVEITAITPTLHVSLEGITLEHVTIDDNTYHSEAVGDDCETELPALALDADLEPLPPQAPQGE